MFDIFLIFARNIDCEYTLEPPHRESKVYPCRPQFYFICVVKENKGNAQ